MGKGARNVKEEQEMSRSIPDEIQHEILLRVPVKSTYVCKCVCKSWYTLISSPDFIKSHLDLTISNNTPNLMLDGSMDIANNYYHFFYKLDHDSIKSSLSSTLEFHTYASEIDYPFGCHVNLLMGSCNGLVPLWLSDLSDDLDDSDREFCVLWNPASGEYKEIDSRAAGIYTALPFTLTAFGYDCKNDDYKLVIGVDAEAADCWGTNCKYEMGSSAVQVYSLRLNAWKDGIRTVPYNFCGQFSEIGGVLVNGDLHWLARGKKDKFNNRKSVVVSLDISEEKFGELELPEEVLEKKELTAVGVSEGSLCVLVGVVKVCVEVWVMQEYGVRESWTKRCVVTYDRITKCTLLRFICSFKDGKILFGHSGDLLLYDPKSGSVVEPNIPGSLSFDQSKFYFESLVSLNSGTYVGR